MKRIVIGIVLIIGIIGFAQRNSDEVTISAVGDILLDRGVRKIIEEEGYEYPYEKVRNSLNNRDIVVANLECPIYDGNNPVYKRPDIIFKGGTENVNYIKSAGINLLNLANNHTMDHRSEGLLSTIEALNKNHLDYFGAGKNSKDAKKLKIVKINNTRIGFLGYSVFPPEGYVFFPDRPHVAKVDPKRIKIEVKDAKRKCDFLIVSYHWGNEYESYPSENQIKLAHETIDSGADLILGHHPHVLQSIEKYRDKYIFYSLGNFIFDRQIHWGTDETIIANFKIKNKRIVNIELVPIKIINGQPNLAQGEIKEKILNHLKRISPKGHIKES
ncbi:MAG: CapA family protein [Anaeromicrobium sp.]|jgi:poly-gamma-glutamate synthesis protein (capsule biosynthesis protein)|uniref:CapA family protein n=1 Tax=Anaeromicrobium sp. TaxID=1929132 RepID=UPI0025D187F7|nr:CapA family protein [Anaeromicrobium sp.]MCT4594428.1 CapA family protein [Anaeromicrobium sp.]